MKTSKPYAIVHVVKDEDGRPDNQELRHVTDFEEWFALDDLARTAGNGEWLLLGLACDHRERGNGDGDAA
jgi:hypothetical protein